MIIIFVVSLIIWVLLLVHRLKTPMDDEVLDLIKSLNICGINVTYVKPENDTNEGIFIIFIK